MSGASPLGDARGKQPSQGQAMNKAYSLEDTAIEIPDPVQGQRMPDGMEGLRWTEILAIVAMAALLVTGGTFLLGLFG